MNDMPTATKDKTDTPRKRPAKKVAAAPIPAPARDGRGQIQVRLPQDLIDRLDVEAERRRVSKTFLVEQMIATSLPRWEEQEIAVP
jgi:predicted HicB family RNase H-like nuclease